MANNSTLNSFVSVKQSLQLAHVINVARFSAKKVDYEAYSNRETQIANLSLKLMNVTSIDSLNYADLASVAKLAGTCSTYSFFDGKDKHGKKAEPMILSCKADGSLFFTILKRPYSFTTVDNLAHTHKMIKLITAKKHADVAVYDSLTNDLYKAVDKAVYDYLKGKGVFNWNLNDKVETYRLYMRDCLNRTVTDNLESTTAILKAEAEAEAKVEDEAKAEA